MGEPLSFLMLGGRGLLLRIDGVVAAWCLFHWGCSVNKVGLIGPRLFMDFFLFFHSRCDFSSNRLVFLDAHRRVK